MAKIELRQTISRSLYFEDVEIKLITILCVEEVRVNKHITQWVGLFLLSVNLSVFSEIGSCILSCLGNQNNFVLLLVIDQRKRTVHVFAIVLPLTLEIELSH